ncbi:MAG: hypothetical protein OEZ32_03710 [Nitrospinota bacterium]|nr:hypothetical protein [Nitrospinota bacterium]
MYENLTNKIADALLWLFDDPSDVIRLARIIAIALPIAFIGAITSILKGMWMYALISLLGVPALAVAGFAFVQGFAGTMGGLYHSGSRQMNHQAITKSMYSLAGGYTRAGQFAMARDKYMEIIETYPEELDAHYLLANLLDEHFGLPEEALKLFSGLRRKIREKNIDYKYKVALAERITELEKYLKEEVEGKRGGR